MQYRVRALEQAKVHEREEAVKQAAWERWLNQGLEPIPSVHPVAPPRAAQFARAGGEYGITGQGAAQNIDRLP